MTTTLSPARRACTVLSRRARFPEATVPRVAVEGLARLTPRVAEPALEQRVD